MARIDGKKAAQESLMDVARLAVAAAYRAPQMTARMNLRSEIVTGEDLRPIIELFEAIIPISPVMYFDYYSYKYFLDNNEPLPLLLLGADLTKSELGWDCGACGFETCAEFNAYTKKNKGRSALWGGPTCNWKLMDFAAACDFACAAVAQYRFDGRIMGTVGAAASNVGYLPDCSAVLGLPIGPLGDFNWFSRRQNFGTSTQDMHMQWLRQTSPTNWQAFPGSTKPCTKTKQDWWNDMQYVKFESMNEEELKVAGEAMQKVQSVSEKYYEKVSGWYGKKEE